MTDFSQYEVTPNAAPASPVAASPINGDFSQYEVKPENVSLGPTTGIADHDESDRFTQEDPGANWLEKSWNFLNKPLTESLFGWGQYREGAGGFERGAEKVLSGLTTPLSLGLMAAFAPAGLLEGVAGTTLKEGLVEGGTLLGDDLIGNGLAAAGKVENYAKAVDAAKKAQMAGTSIADAVSSATGGGLQYQEFLNFGQFLRGQGMQETDMLSESLARRMASQGLRKVGATPGQALRIAKSTETMINMGFGVQQLHGAIYAYPRMFDLMSQGDYDGAAEYMVEGTVGTVFGGLGVAHGLHSIEDVLPTLNEKNALALSDETEGIKKVFGAMTGDLEASRAKIYNRKRQHMVGLMELAGVDVSAGLRDRVPFLDEEETRLQELQKLDKANNISGKEIDELKSLRAKK
jgi:hypothetical protein